MRPAAAYSTGGWFPDPVLSTMLGGGDDALPELANVILHESVHATVLVPDEPFFNESFANYVADALTDHWIELRFGPGSPEELAWTLGQALHLPADARACSPRTRRSRRVYDVKQHARRRSSRRRPKIIDELVADLQLRKRPNNASLTEVRVYNGGAAAAARGAPRVRRSAVAGRCRKTLQAQRLREDAAGGPRPDRQAAREAVPRNWSLATAHCIIGRDAHCLPCVARPSRRRS